MKAINSVQQFVDELVSPSLFALCFYASLGCAQYTGQPLQHMLKLTCRLSCRHQLVTD